MRKIIFSISVLTLLVLSSDNIPAQKLSKFIITDQFGYLPGSEKIAVIRDPQTGFDSLDSFIPGNSYSLVKVTNGEKVYTAGITPWASGLVDESSGDKVWHFDFSAVNDPGNYYVLDNEKNLRSYEFIIAENVYNEVLKHAMR